MTTERKLDGKVALITGAASGIGAACAELFARNGAKLALIDLQADALSEVAGRIRRDMGGDVIVHVADVTDRDAIAQAVDATVGKYGSLDVVMPCSGISTGGTVDSIDEEIWDHVFDVNVKGVYLCLHASIPHLLKAGSGSIVLLGSQLVFSSRGSNAAYIASKGAIVALTRTMAVDYASRHIRVNAVIPGVIDTPMSRRSLTRYPDAAETRRRWEANHLMNRFGRPEEVAAAALFLACSDSSFTTGSLLYCDGGWCVM